MLNKDRLHKDDGGCVITTAKYIGRSHMEKDCYWSCYRDNAGFYISLNDEPDYVWEVSEETWNQYLEVLA